MPKKKVLILPGALKTGGAEKVARDIALYADPEKYEFHYLVFGEAEGTYEGQLRERGCAIFHFPEPSEGYLRYFRRLFGLLQREHYRVIHAHTMFSCGWAMLAGKIAGVPIRIAHAHSALLDGNGFVKACYEGVMRGCILAFATDLAACSDRAGMRLFGKRAWKRRGVLLPNGIDNRAFSFQEEHRWTIRRRYGLEHCFVLGHAGHLTAVKNQSFLLELLGKLLEIREDARLLLLGEGEDRPFLAAKVRALGLENYVVFAGNVSDVGAFYSAMDVFCFPSLYEGMPLALLEARANGLPCIVSDRVEPEGLPLTDMDAWVDAVLNAKRGPGQSGMELREAMERVYALYEQDQNVVPD